MNDIIQTDVSVARSSPGESAPSEFRYCREQTELINALDESVTALFKLSGIARRAVTRDRFALSLSRIEKSRVLSETDEADLLSEVYPRLLSPNLGWLRLRLVAANNSRRRYVLYCEEHQARIRDDTSTTSAVEHKLAPEDDKNDETASVLAETTASTAVAARVETSEDVENDTASLPSFVSYGTETGTYNIRNVPDLEEVRQGQDTFVCPYCRTEQFCETQRAWRRHVFSDLRTYTCTHEACDLRLFEDTYAWVEHELSEHLLQTTCPYCLTNIDKKSPSAFETHLHSNHPSRFSAEQIPQLKNIATQEPELVPASLCHFCDWQAMLRDRDDSVPRSTDVLVPVKRYRRHVGAHLEQVALAVIVTSQQDAEIEETAHGDAAGLPKRPDDGSSDHWEDAISEASSKSESPERFSRMEAAQPAHTHEVCENVTLLSLQYTLLNIVLMFLQPSLRSERSNVREEVENPLRVSAETPPLSNTEPTDEVGKQREYAIDALEKRLRESTQLLSLSNPELGDDVERQREYAVDKPERVASTAGYW